MIVTAPPKLMTAQELERLPDDGYKYELVRGEVVRMAPPGGAHGGMASRIDRRLGPYVEANRLGEVLIETGYILAHDPDLVRAPDVSFLAQENIPVAGLPDGFINHAPDLAIEIVSPGDLVTEVAAKVAEYLAHGTRLVWVIEKKTRSVTVYRLDGSAQMLRAATNSILSGEDVIPGFAIPVHELF